VTTRTTEARAVDLLLELSAIDSAARVRPVRLGAVVFQKILFWATTRLRELSFAGPRLLFYRYLYGPFSNDLAQDVATLRRLGHVRQDSFRLSVRGEQLVRYWRPLLEPKNPEVFAILDATASELGPLTAEAAKRRTYALPAERVGADPKYGTLEGVPDRMVLLLRKARDLRPFAVEHAQDLVFDLSLTGEDVELSKSFSSPARRIDRPEDVEALASEFD
jgi:hypothetical protein